MVARPYWTQLLTELENAIVAARASGRPLGIPRHPGWPFVKVAVHASLAIVVAATSSPGLSQSAVAQDLARCSVNPIEVPRRPVRFDGVVVGAIPPERVKVATEKVEKQTGARISPDYADLPRIVAKFVTSRKTFETIAAVVDGHIPRPGDHVDLLSRYRDPRSHCNFIPVTVSAPAAVS